jgi:Formyl transferase
VLTTVFIGSHNRFDEMLVHWLAQRTNLAGVVWTRSAWRSSWRTTARFAWGRARHRGPLKALDEAAFHLWYRRFRHPADAADLQREILDPYRAEHGRVRWRGDAITTRDVNSPEVRAFLAERGPDVVFAVCVSAFFEAAIRRIPKHGVLLWHEGITPEYRGLYSPFWAAHNLDRERIGATLLRMDDELDAGQPYVQVTARDVDPRRHGHLYMGHKAVADSLPAVERLLAELETGIARPLERGGAVSAYYSYPGLTDLLRQRRRLGRA